MKRMAIFDFIKKSPSGANPSNGSVPSGAPTPPPANMQPPSGQVYQSTQPAVQNSMPASAQPQMMQQSQSYNGIGTPASGQSYNGIGGSNSYNGIGSTPSGGTPYNGIGNPMPQPVQQQTMQPPVPKAPVVPTPAQPVQQIQRPAQPTQVTVTNTVTPPAPTKPVAQQSAPQINTKPPAPAQTSTNTNTPSKPAAPVNSGAPLKSNINGDKRSELDVMTHMTQRSNKVFLETNNKAKQLKNVYVDSEHLLHGLMTDGEIYKILVDLKIQPQLVEEELNKVYKKENSPTPPQISPRVKQITNNSLVVARNLGYEFISPEHILLSLVDENEGMGARTLTKLGLKKADLFKKITGKSENLDWNTSASAKDKAMKQQRSALQQYTVDLTEKAANGELDPVVERSDVIERVVHVLSRRIKNNPALIGEPGVGKTAIVEGLAQRIVNKQVPESLLGKKILVLDLMSVVAGASHRGEFEERMKNLVDELKGAKGQVIMFIDEMHTMMGAGSGDGALDASNFIKPALARGEVQLIGATTIMEYRKYIEKDAALERRFQTVLVPEPNIEQAVKMLKASRDKYESFHKVKIADDVIDLAVKLSKRYIGDRFLPDKGFDLMDEAAAAVRLPMISLPEEIKSIEDQIGKMKAELADYEKTGQKVRARITRSKIDETQAQLNSKKDEYNMKKAQTTTEVTEDIVKDIISRRTGIPISKISSTEGDKLVNLEDIIHSRMIDQERAVKSVSQAIRRGRAGLKATNRPIGSFVFLGPSGVGKTELAKTISEVLFDEEDAVLRFDMTEYMERHEVAKLLGPPPGYVGFEDGGKLTEAVRRRPYALVLFDEIEKAHPDIFNILLQILDDARLTDNKGRTISFKNTVIICTSNIGTRLIQEELLKSGKTEVNEPRTVSTYVFTPRGREILTIANKYFERDGVTANSIPLPKNEETPKLEGSAEDAKPVGEVNAGTENVQNSAKEKDNKDTEKKDNAGKPATSWNEHMLPEYFAGQKLDGAPPKKEEAPTPEELGLEKEQPTEAENKDDQDKKKEESKTDDYTTTPTGFPSFGYDTHAISSQGLEIVTRGNTVYSRTSTTSKIWNVTNLIEYFKDQIVINALPDAPDEQLPTIRLKTHAFSPDEKEVVSYKDRFWRKKQNASDWETGLLKDYFFGQSLEGDGQMPVTHWDIHTFSPAGREIIIVGNDIWYRDAEAVQWKKQLLSDYFGKDFPLDKEIEEKNKVEEETEKKKYDIIKEKVMNELLKFFRPELVNRFDEVIIFEPLKFIHMISIVKLQLKALSKLLEEQEIGFSVTDTAIKQIVREGFDPIFGARPLRRAIQKLVENPISELIIAKKVKTGDMIIVDYDGEEFIFNIEKIEKIRGTQNTQTVAKKAQKFFCEKCANSFVTDVIPTATTICTKCASSQVQAVSEEEKKTPEKPISPDAPVKESQAAIANGPKPPPPIVDDKKQSEKLDPVAKYNNNPINENEMLNGQQTPPPPPKPPAVSGNQSQPPQPVQMNTV